MTDKAEASSYNPNYKPLAPHNRRVAKRKGWHYDPDWEAYRDQFGYLLDPHSPAPQNNAVDAMR